MACDLGCWINWLLAAITVVSFPLYVCVLIVLVARRKQLDSSFFTICISLGVADLSCLFAKFCTRRVAAVVWGIFPGSHQVISSTAFQTGSMALGWSTYYVQVFGAVILCVNRTVKVYGKYWSNKMTVAAIVVQWLWAFPFALPMLFPCCRSRLASNISFRPISINPKFGETIWDATILLEVGAWLPLLVSLHLAMLIKVVKHRQQVSPSLGNNNDNQTASAEKNLVVIGGVLCGSYVFMLIGFAIVWANGGHFVNGLHGLVTAVWQCVFTAANPYLLLGFSSVFREHFVSFWKRKPM